MAIAIRRPGFRSSRLDESLHTAHLLLKWRPMELARARREFRRLSRVDLEDIYDETVDALRGRSHDSEIHLRRAVRVGVRLRALRLIRDRDTHERVIDQAAVRLHLEGEARARDTRPEQAVLAQEDNFILGEFIAELTQEERRVFALNAEGLSWRAIATELAIDPNEARCLTRAVERKRERFVTLYETGRLCGYRSQTIETLLSKQTKTEMALGQALAHLRHCHACQMQHRITGAALKARFEQGALALLPPLAPHTIHLSLLDRVSLILEKPIRLLDRLTPGGAPVRDRVVEAAAATGASVKVAGTVAGVIAVVATGVTVGVHAVLPTTHHHHVQHPPAATLSHAATTSPVPGITSLPQPLTTATTGTHPTATSIEHERRIARAFGPGRVVGEPHRTNTEGQHAPGGFAYLGVPHKRQGSSETATAIVASNSTSSTSEQHTASSSGTEGQTRGGPFSP